MISPRPTSDPPSTMSKTYFRLIIVSSRARNKLAIYASVLPNVIVMEYTYETNTLQDIADLVKSVLKKENVPRVVSIAFVLHSSERELFICQPGAARLNLKTIINAASIREFFTNLVNNHLDTSNWAARLDFLATYAAEHIDGGLIARELETILGCQVSLDKGLEGKETKANTGSQDSKAVMTVGEMYFDKTKLKINMDNVGRVGKDGSKKLLGYEKIRVVGKGAFGNAVLYRRKDDQIMCILKEINMLDLSASDRQMALNEVKVLAQMDHPNIVAYHDSFERDGILMIEMEYADGGNLQEFLAKQNSLLSEKLILDIVHQMVSAISYMHAHNVLHRDLKTANIFLTKEGLVKIGDFGISKMLTTKQGGGANTVLGTPYYISPEMCEGKTYDDKSDIWALGCIVYEMACLQKTFEGDNLPALVKKIMSGQFAPIRGPYSSGFKQLVRDLLQTDPDFRPAASDVLLKRMPDLLGQFENRQYHHVGMSDEEDMIDEELMLDPHETSGNESMHASASLINPTFRKSSSARPAEGRPPRSVLYYMKAYESGVSLMPVQLPPRTTINQVSVSGSHIIALTSEQMVFTWGDGRRGQLGHGELETWRSRPHCVEALKAKSISRIAAGEGFSVFASDNGILMTCGDGTFGCLGHGDWQSLSVPKLVESLLTVDISAVACGSGHVVIVGRKGDVYSWGRGSLGRLGLGNEEDCCTPQEVKLQDDEVYIVNVRCNGAATILMAETGALYAYGENNENRLGLADDSWFAWPWSMYSSGNDEDVINVPTQIKSLKHRIVDVSMGPDHTVCLTEHGKVVTMGRNIEAQLGKSHNHSGGGKPYLVKSMSEKEVSLISAGATFTVVGTTENVVYFWGTRHISPTTRPSTRDAFGESFGTRLATPLGKPLSESEMHSMLQLEEIRRNLSSGEFHTIPEHSNSNINSLMGNRQSYDHSVATLSSTELMRHSGEIAMKDVVFDPQEILALFASAESQAKGETLMLRDIHSMNQNIFIVVETTCPIHKASTANPNNYDQPHFTKEMGNQEPQVVLDMNDHDISDMDESNDALPEWLKNDLEDANADHPDNNNKKHKENNKKRNKKREQKSQPRKGKEAKREQHNQANRDSGNIDANSQEGMTTTDRDKYVERLEKEYDRKRKQLLLEAENAVRVREEAFNQELVRLNQELEKHKKMQRDQLDSKKKSSSSSTKKTSVDGDTNGNKTLGNDPSENDEGKGCSIQ